MYVKYVFEVSVFEFKIYVCHFLIFLNVFQGV